MEAALPIATRVSERNGICAEMRLKLNSVDFGRGSTQGQGEPA